MKNYPPEFKADAVALYEVVEPSGGRRVGVRLGQAQEEGEVLVSARVRGVTVAGEPPHRWRVEGAGELGQVPGEDLVHAVGMDGQLGVQNR